MADGDRAVGSKQDWRSVKCGHGFVLGGPCEGCRRCEHGVSAFGGVPCPMCTGINPLAESPRRDLVLGNDEPGLDLWREYAAAFLNTANVWDGDDGEPCEPDESMRNLGGMP